MDANNPKEQARQWLAWVCRVPVSAVTDEHIDQWVALSMSIRSVRPSKAQASRARHLAYSEGAVRPSKKRPRDPAKDNARMWFGPRPLLAGEE